MWSSQLSVTLTPRTSTVLSTGTTVIFDITTAGTASIGTPVYSIVTATYDGGSPSSASINAAGTELTITFPANTSYTAKTITGRVKITIDGNDFTSNLAIATQNAAGSLEFDNATSTVHSTATTSTQSFTNHNCTNVGVYSASTGTNATISGSDVEMSFQMNTGSTSVTRSVCLSGKTPDNETVYTTHTMTQEAALNTSFTAQYTGGNVPSSGATIPASSFTLTLVNASLSSVSADGVTFTTGGTEEAPTLTVTVPANQTDGATGYTITMTATDIYGRTLTQTITIPQDSDAYTFSVTPNPQSADFTDTSATATVTTSNILVETIGVGSTSGAVTNATYNSGTLTVQFPANPDLSGREMTVTLTGTTTGGRNVSVVATVNQAGQAYSPSISPSATAVTLPAYVEGAYDGSDVSGSVVFTYNDLSGYTVSKTSGIKTATVTTGGTNTARFTIEQNETTSPVSPVGTITLTGHGNGGTDVTLVITVNQEAGVDPSLVMQYSPQDIAADGTSASDNIIYNYVKPDSIAYTATTGNITSVTIS